MSIQCKKCSYTARYKSSVDLHERTVHSEVKPVACPFSGCDFKTKTKKCVQRHQRIHETKLEVRKPYLCNYANCQFRTGREYNLKLHVKARHTARTREFQCGLCHSSFYSKKGLRLHIARHVKERRYACKDCEFTTYSRESLGTHVKFVHKNLVTFDCSFPGCSYSSTYRLAARRHYQQAHSSHPGSALRRPVVCSFPGCDFRARFLGDLKNHIRVHHDPGHREDHACSLCPRKFYSIYILRGHINSVHTKEMGFKCSKCHFVSPWASNVTRHHKTVHEKKKLPVKWFACQSCDYGAHSKQSLDLHIMTAHTSQRTFQCEQAGCKFKTNYAKVFKQHLLLHQVDPQRQFPVMCSFPGCDFRRRIPAEMKLHERRHAETREVQFQCKICPNMFSYPDKNSLLFHNYMRHDEKLFKCSVCDYSSLHKNGLLCHMRLHHDHESPSRSLQESQDEQSSWRHLTACSKAAVVLIPRIKLKAL